MNRLDEIKERLNEVVIGEYILVSDDKHVLYMDRLSEDMRQLLEEVKRLTPTKEDEDVPFEKMYWDGGALHDRVSEEIVRRIVEDN